MDSFDQYAFIVATIENDQFSISRDLLMYSPEKVMVFFFGRGYSEMGDSNSLRVYALEDSMDDSILSTSIHCLSTTRTFFLCSAKSFSWSSLSFSLSFLDSSFSSSSLPSKPDVSLGSYLSRSIFFPGVISYLPAWSSFVIPSQCLLVP